MFGSVYRVRILGAKLNGYNAPLYCGLQYAACLGLIWLNFSSVGLA